MIQKIRLTESNSHTTPITNLQTFNYIYIFIDKHVNCLLFILWCRINARRVTQSLKPAVSDFAGSSWGNGSSRRAFPNSNNGTSVPNFLMHCALIASGLMHVLSFIIIFYKVHYSSSYICVYRLNQTFGYFTERERQLHF